LNYTLLLIIATTTAATMADHYVHW